MNQHHNDLKLCGRIYKGNLKMSKRYKSLLEKVDNTKQYGVTDAAAMMATLKVLNLMKLLRSQ